ncbi:MAG: ATP-binding protein, partial [Lachnospiraceae bacterium]|nr:ATP-binding protein [Lachnospiraceae bacterium]
YSNTEYTITQKVDKNIKNKINDLIVSTGTKYAIYPTLVTTYGMVDNSYSSNIQSVVTMDDLFKYKDN